MPETSKHLLEQLSDTGPWGGPSYRYRDAEIWCLPGAHVCGLVMPKHLLHGCTFGTITPLVDLRLDEGRLPAYYRVARKA